MPETGRRATYHHGALREELISACLRLIETEGIGAVSLRRVARAAGVSPGAPYHHFADRAALLGAISATGYALLSERLRAARAAADRPVAALAALVEAYVRFARDEPAYFQLMFRPELSRPEDSPEAKRSANAAFAVLCEVIDDCALAGVVSGQETGTLIGAVWALAHGLASLRQDGQLDERQEKLGADPDALTTRVVRLLESTLDQWAR